MSIVFYRYLHIVGIILVTAALAGIGVHLAHGGTKETFRWRGKLAALHGTGLLLLLVSGFGMLAKLGMSADMPWWVVAKLVFWLALGGAIALAYRQRERAGTVLAVCLVVAMAAAYLGLFHG